MPVKFGVEESKIKGKAAVVGGRFGKGGGAAIQQFMFLFIGPVAVVAPYTAIILLAIVSLWIVGVLKPHKLFVSAGGERI